jgi:hypothetical protein
MALPGRHDRRLSGVNALGLRPERHLDSALDDMPDLLVGMRVGVDIGTRPDLE